MPLRKNMGQAAQIPCGHCGTLNNVSDQFCANCGYLLAGGPTGTIPVLTPAGRRVTGALVRGELLGGRYRNVELVGKGGFGAVYKANDERFQGRRVVAIKEMSDAHLSPRERSQALKDFRQEADLLVQLKHPNLPDVSDFFEEHGKAYLVMEFIEGRTLAKVQDDAGGPLDEQLVMGWALQLCDVLSYLHTQPQPIVFRDLKPSNVMVTKNGQVKLIDFGIARVFKSTAAKDTTTLGSRGYAPLEQYGRGQSDARSDIYALGATLYDLLTNTVPADAPTRRVNPLAFEEPRQLNPAISNGTGNIILKAMAEESKDRYQSALEMFQAIVASGVIPATSPARSYAAALPNFATIPALSTQAATLPAPSTPPAQQPLVLPATSTQVSSQANPAAAVSQTVPAPTTPQVSAPPTFSPQPSQQHISRRALLTGGLVTAGILVGGGLTAAHFLSSSANSGAGAGPAVTVNFAYSTEKDAWLTAAAQAFNNQKIKLAHTTKLIQVELGNSGSLDVGDKIARGEIRPAAWSPASDLELNRLDYQWGRSHNGQLVNATDTAFSKRDLVYSPLVFAVWKDHALAFLQKYPKIDWDTIYHALSLPHGWADLGHPEWSSINLGQTRPNTSNSGLLTLMLMTYSYTSRTQRLSSSQLSDSRLWNYIGVFESAVNEFGLSSGTYFTDTVIANPPSAHAITMTYENLALEYQSQAQQSQQEPLLIYYPGLNAVSNHPFAILDAPWVSDEQKTAAMQFRDFLLGADQQRQALTYGFRPSDPSIQLADPSIKNNPFAQLSRLAPDHTFDLRNDPRANVPSGDIVDALITQWGNHYPNP